MDNLLIYLVRSFFCLGTLYIIWWLFMSKDTFFTVNRFYLISSIFLSLLIPIFDFSYISNIGRFSTTYIMDAVTIKPGEIQSIYSNNLSVFQGIIVVYLTGVGIFTIRFFLQLFQLIRLIKRYGISNQDGLKFVFTESNYAPFSFFGLIFLNNKFSRQDLEKIIIHESVHIKQGHSFDLLLLEMLTIVQWFNPFTWLYRNSLKSVHEYLADEGVLLKGVDRINYQDLLLSLTYGIQISDLTNNINKSLIKRRFSMMFKEKSKINSTLKYLLVVPFVIIVLIAFGIKDSTLKAFTPVTQDSVYTKSDVEPSFPGGIKELQKFIISNINYPEESRKNNIEGAVLVTFVVKSNGKIEDIKIKNSVNPELDNEAVRVVKLMPDWIPGEVNGERVDVMASLPFKFRLSN